MIPASQAAPASDRQAAVSRYRPPLTMTMMIQIGNHSPQVRNQFPAVARLVAGI
jgi:hypothetical protein